MGVTIEHRFHPEHPFPAALQDAKAAVRWLRANADTFDINPARIGIVGASSGGHLGALVGTTDGVPEFEGEGNPGFSSAVQAVAAFNAPLDLVNLRTTAPDWSVENLNSFLGGSYSAKPDWWANASPINHVTPASPPFLLLRGTLDDQVPYHQSVQMKDALTEAGVSAELFTAENAGHGFFNSEPWLSLCNGALEDFLARMLKEQNGRGRLGALPSYGTGQSCRTWKCLMALHPAATCRPRVIRPPTAAALPSVES